MNLWLIPILPFLGFLINGLFGRRFPKSMVNLFGVGSVALSFLWAVKTLVGLSPLETKYVEHYFTWIQSGALNIAIDFAVDRLTAVMLMVVTGVGLLIHIYSIGYMAEEGGYYRFFSYLNLFMFFMLVLVLAQNFLLLFVGWEGVGLCSYLLIGFYFLEKYATNAGNKAFIVNRIGDFGFALAMFLIVRQFGSLDFTRVFDSAKAMPNEASIGILTTISLLLLVGATGKSAQIPLYVWLPDAMAGPTPVSALIHAATMVTAGVYMTARSAALFTHAPIAMDTVAVIGLATAFFAATIGMAQTDIKKVFAYSTVSQLGYMFLGVGVGAFSAGIFHLMTHAFFKALLFLGAGAVIHGLHGEQDLRQMGGLFKHMRITAITLLCASFAISGFPFTSGFFSKDAILVAAYARAPWMYWVGVFTAGLTAFYVFRAWFLAFTGEYRGHAHPHESPLVMTGPLMILAALSLGGGFINIPHWLEPMFAEKRRESNAGVGLGGGRRRRHRDRLCVLCRGSGPRRFLCEIDRRPLQTGLQQIFRRRSLRRRHRAARGRGLAFAVVARRRCRFDRRHRERHRHAIARHRRNSAAAAIGEHPQLRRLDRAGIGDRAAGHRLRGSRPMTLLDAVIFLPLIGFLITLALPKDNLEAIRRFSLVASAITFILSLGLIAPFWFKSPGKFVFETDLPWIDSPAIRYHVAIDGISLWLVILSTLLTPICVLVSWNSIQKHVKQFFAFLLLLEFGLIGVFCALDFFLFYVFWEVSLVPMYFLIGIWGHERRIYSAVKFFLYTMAGSALMLVGIIYLYNQAGTFDYTKILAGTAERLDRAQLPGAIAAVPVVLHSLRHQGAAVPAAHLASRRARRGAHGRFGDAGLRHAENGDLRAAALLRADVPQRRAQLRRMDRRRSPSSESSTARWWRWCSPT